VHTICFHSSAQTGHPLHGSLNKVMSKFGHLHSNIIFLVTGGLTFNAPRFIPTTHLTMSLMRWLNRGSQHLTCSRKLVRLSPQLRRSSPKKARIKMQCAGCGSWSIAIPTIKRPYFRPRTPKFCLSWQHRHANHA
jgi:hypothetical protein